MGASPAPQGDDSTLQTAYTKLGEQTVRISQLENENLSLRNQIHVLLTRQRCDQSGDGGDLASSVTQDHQLQQCIFNNAAVKEDGTISSEDLKQQLNALKAELASLHSDHADCDTQLRRMRQKVRDAKERCHEWKEYAEKCRRKREEDALAGTEGSRPTSRAEKRSSGDLTPRAKRMTSRPVVQKEVDRAVSADTALLSSPPLRLKICPDVTLPSTSRPAEPQFTSSQSTVEATQQPPADNLPDRRASSDSSDPLVLCSRTLKRRCATSAPAEPPSRRVKQEHDPPDLPVHIKSEDSSSPPSPTRLIRTETSDLDYVAAPVHIPRRLNCVEDLRPRATSEEAARRAPKLTRAASSLSEGDNVQVLPVVVRREVQRNRGIDCLLVTHDGSSPASRNVLRPLSSNVVAVPRAKDGGTNPKIRLRRIGKNDRVSNAMLISEDGDEQAAGLPPVESMNASPPKGPIIDERLDAMLASQTSSQKPQCLQRPAHVLGVDAQPQGASPRLPTTVPRVTGLIPSTRRSPLKVPLGLEQPPPDAQPEDQPLRLRHVKELMLEDFKINPKYLGTTFAFADTLRGRDQRRGLNTCTDPACCGGAMEKAITMAGPSLSGMTDGQALDAFLGPTWEEVIDSSNAEQRKEIVKQAHIYAFSNQHGKHRQAFSRRSTPPGFWDTDFPTTQEAAANRAKAVDMERQKVEERWREAMREDGRWKFRDE